MKKIFYWSPCLDMIGTVKSTINSASSIARYSKKNIKIKLINSCGEWEKYKEILKRKEIEVIDFYKSYYDFLPKKGFIQSRLSNLIVFLLSFFPLLKLLKKEKPDFVIIHLITSLPLILLKFFNFNTKFILRISGYPRLNFSRKFLWRMLSKKIFKVTCPSKDLADQLKKLKIFPEEKIFFLPDAVFSIEYLRKKIKENQNKKLEKNFFLAVGRLTKQKNFSYLIDEFSKYVKNNPSQKLFIFGEGEEKKKLKKQIIDNRLEDNIFLKGNSNLIFNYMRNAQLFILSSLWEEPGIVLIESALNNLFIISSNCKNGPREFLNNGKGGILFENNLRGELLSKIVDFKNLSREEKKLRTLAAKKNSRKYSMFNHYKELSTLLT